MQGGHISVLCGDAAQLSVLLEIAEIGTIDRLGLNTERYEKGYGKNRGFHGFLLGTEIPGTGFNCF
jgi:hypothetical protein